jgi:hypothetical protein
MAGEGLPARFSLRSQFWFWWTEKCFETATSHIQNVGIHLKNNCTICIIYVSLTYNKDLNECKNPRNGNQIRN